LTDAVLHIEDLSLDFATAAGPVHALRAVSLDVPRGEIVGIVGESGSGKSTLALVIMRLLATNARVTSGSVVFASRDMLAHSEEEMRAIRGDRIAMVFQDPMTSLNPVRSIGQQMCDIQHRDRAARTADKRAKAVAALRKVGIPDAEGQLDNYPFQFSGGMRQRIAIAMALLQRPTLLIADEVTTAIDVTLEAQILHLLRELRGEIDGSILFISHNLGAIAEICDRIAVFYAGEIVEQGPIGRIFDQPQHPYTRALIACDPARIAVATRQLPVIPGDVPNLRTPPKGCIFAARCPQVMDRCRSEKPGDRVVAEGHTARCHLLSTEAPS
jgi:oligopeptide/dipeptide ABC transporter ATP-binding protein